MKSYYSRLDHDTSYVTVYLIYCITKDIGGLPIRPELCVQNAIKYICETIHFLLYEGGHHMEAYAWKFPGSKLVMSCVTMVK